MTVEVEPPGPEVYAPKAARITDPHARHGVLSADETRERYPDPIVDPGFTHPPATTEITGAWNGDGAIVDLDDLQRALDTTIRDEPKS